MSASSGTTLISPTAATTSTQTNATRRNSSHGAHAPQGHHVKRRGSNLAHHVVPGPGRRLSDGEAGRRAVTSGLTMHALDQPKVQRKSSHDPPISKASRSDTHLPRLTRTTSTNSHVSNTSQGSAKKQPKKGRKRSGKSVQVVSESGNEAEFAGSSDEGWESGDGEPAPAQRKTRSAEDGLRRTVSESPASTSEAAMANTREAASNAFPISPGALPAEVNHPHPHTMKTTGFSGSVQTPDPQLTMQTHLNEATPHWNDSMHIMPAHQLKHQQSARTLAALAKADDAARSEGSGIVPAAFHRMRTKTISASSGISTNASSSFPFPNVDTQPSELTPPTSSECVKPRIEHPLEEKSRTRTRLASGTETHRIRHRRSNSSLRSVQSMRAPPHPLNSPTDYRSGMVLDVGTSRSGSTLNSPKRDNGPIFHNPPIAPPVVYREVVSGQGWDHAEGRPSSGIGEIDSHDLVPRKISSSSTRSLKDILTGPTPHRSDVPATSSSPSSQLSQAQPSRRRTAVEAASAMTKLPTTNNPALYHHSRGYPSSSAETAFLISRFLPQKKVTRPKWEISATALQEGHDGIGLTNGEYREAHESLIRGMRELSVGTGTTSTRRSKSKGYTHQALLVSSSDLGSREGIGMVNGRNGPMVVARGGWRGKTPFELSVERCLTQRPKRSSPGLQQ